MDEIKKIENPQELEEHRLATVLKSNPNNKRLTGYIGKSQSDNEIYLYTSLDFDDFYAIKKADIIHHETVDSKVLEFGGTSLWISENSKIKHTKVQSGRIASDFLKGHLVDKSINSIINALDLLIDVDSTLGCPGPRPSQICNLFVGNNELVLPAVNKQLRILRSNIVQT